MSLTMPPSSLIVRGPISVGKRPQTSDRSRNSWRSGRNLFSSNSREGRRSEKAGGTYTFDPSQTLGEVVAKLKEADVALEATVALMSPRAPLLVDSSKTVVEAGVKGRVQVT
jgi:hypothetical protein